MVMPGNNSFAVIRAIGKPECCFSLKFNYRVIINNNCNRKYICDHYHRGCFQVRNEWMVDHSALLIAAYTGEKGGTKNTVDYAARKGVQIIFVL